MQAATTGAGSQPAAGTGSETIADLLPLAVQKYGDAPAQRFKVGDEWHDVSYNELGDTVREVALGLIDLGIEPGEKISILAHTRPEWTHACFGILTTGASLVTIYQTNSPEECQYVLAHSDSRAVFVEDAEQLAKIRAIEGDCPELKHVIVLDPGDADVGDAITLEALRERGRGRDAAEWKERYEAVTPDDICLYIYTSGTTGPPKGCLLSHANYRAITDAVVEDSVLEGGDCSYLFLPLAHAFAILIQFASFELGVTLAYWSRDPKMIIADIAQVSPSFFPSVPRMFEKIYTLATSNIPDKEGLRKAVEVGVKVRMMREAGEEVPEQLQQAFDASEEQLFKNVRGLFGTRMRECVTGAAPIASEILEFFFACGVPVMEGYGMTETSTSASVNRTEGNQFRFGSVGKPQPGVEVKIGEDGEVLIKGPNIFKGYYKNAEATEEALENGWLHTGDLGRLDEDGFLYITGRKKDIIITAGGKNITPANLENGLKQTRWISQAVVIGDRRPYLVALITLDPEEAPALAEQLGLQDASLPAMARDARVRAEVQRALDDVNSHVGPVEQIKRFEILDHDLSQETGELTPTLKVKRNVVHEKYADLVDRIYDGAR
ncbi:MAG: long-chain acyl-CoA synthetase [Thermoleophilaceae bacterium]|jgi:long-chain acyl-CoA synthetase|nr:long-chain acyl-CoA synthetase [Thermoleophilaceae bacterium]